MPDSAGAESNVQQIGAYLREARQARGVTLDEAARVTRISKLYLAAIEDGTFEKLPNAAYAKGFLRNYAGYLGMSGDEVVSRYEDALTPAGVRPAERAARLHEAQAAIDRPASKTGSRGRWYASLLLLLLVLAAAYVFRGEEERPNLPILPASRTESALAPSPVQPRSSSAVMPGQAVPTALPEAGMEVTAQPASEQQPGGIVLRLKVNQESWLNITIDGNISQQYDLKAGDLIEWKGEKYFTLDLGNAGGVEAEFNGRQLKSLGEQGKAIHLVLRAESPDGQDGSREKTLP